MTDTQLNEQLAGTQAEPLPEVTQQAALGPGAQLAAHRQAQGFTVEQVANQLNLAPRQIQALEADNYAALPGVVIARGFIRAYAKLLKVDPAPLVSLMHGEVAPMESLQLKRALSGSFSSESRLPSPVRSGLLSKWAIGSMLVVLVVVGVYVVHWLGLIPGFSESVSDNIEKGTTFLSSSTNGTSSDHANAMSDNAVSTSPSSSYEAASSNRVTNDAITAPITATAIIPTPAPTNTPANAPTTASTPTKISADPTVPAPASINIPAKAPTVIPAPTNTAAAPKPAAPAIAPTPPVTLASPSPVAKAITPANQDNPSATNKNMLIIKVREDSWVEIKDANDRTLISRLMAAGTTETLSVAKPVFLTVGNAAGVDVTLRGKSVDLKSSAKSNVARLNLK